jgi:hypothetical protein
MKIRTTLTLTKEEARDGILAAFTDKFPEHTAHLADPETVIEIRQFDIAYEGVVTDPVIAEAIFLEEE